mgnify:CR=1 FL=1
MSSIKEGVQVLVFFIGLFLILGTVGLIEMTENPDWIVVAGQAILGFVLMWIGAKGVDKLEWYRDRKAITSDEEWN